MLFAVLCLGTGSGSDFKASQKTGRRLKVSSDRLGEAGSRTCDPWFNLTHHSDSNALAFMYSIFSIGKVYRQMYGRKFSFTATREQPRKT